LWGEEKEESKQRALQGLEAKDGSETCGNEDYQQKSKGAVGHLHILDGKFGQDEGL
jgi:hypothetical protein